MQLYLLTALCAAVFGLIHADSPEYQKYIGGNIVLVNGENDHDGLEKDGENRVKMGVATAACDNANVSLEVDWDPSDKTAYQCSEQDRQLFQAQQAKKPAGQDRSRVQCLDRKLLKPDHFCMDTRIEYFDNPPRGEVGHRPLWAKYGEYDYVPPQRWAHNLEHGAIVMLYHPCTDETLVDNLRQVVTGSLWRHVITPFRNMTSPLALVAFGCRLMMDEFNYHAARSFIDEYANHGPETTPMDGYYKIGWKNQTES